MAADEPPYLTIGTDVSAKYKGAFCEAKVKKVNRVVKCKVTFKNNLGTFMVTDDQIKGSLRLGADIDAKHPEKNQFYEAVINKLQDVSQYTVVFDDGDETTLRRTSLCLKSGRHFAESPTLDQFPLTNPEHFGTPVIGSSKFKRKRRSTMNSAVDYESSDDEDSVPRRLKAIRGKEQNPDLGRVVCVDYGDRRKRENWYPGLIYPHPPHSSIKLAKEEHLVRSFKDGKYYQVPKRDIREFTKESIQKIENNSLRIAIEKATSYLEKDELPPNWDKALFASLDALSGEDDSQETDSDTSDDEPSEEKDRFVAQLYKFMDERGTPINKAPSVSNRDLNLYKLFKIMHKLGGYNKVTNKNKWKIVYSKMGLPQCNVNGPNQIKFAYKRFLQSFEDFYRKLGCTMVSNSRSTRGRHRSDRNIIITRTRERASPKSRAKEKVPTDRKSYEKLKASERRDTESLKTEDVKTKSPEKKRHPRSEDINKEQRRAAIPKALEESKPRLARQSSFTKDAPPSEKKTRSSMKKDELKDCKTPPKESKDKKEEGKKKKEEKRKPAESKERALRGAPEKEVEEDASSRDSYERKSEEEPPSKAKRRSLKLDEEKESLFGLSDSDESCTNDSEKNFKHSEIAIGDRVKVKYGRGRLQKVYEAKVLKMEMDGAEKRFYVHYAGWNTRYDEWVRKNNIVANISSTKQRLEGSTLKVKRMDRGQPPGLHLAKPNRKNSTSSGSSCRATRSEKKAALSGRIEAKRRTRRKSVTSVSQESDTDDMSSSFREELFSDDEEKDKMEDANRCDITELEKAIAVEEDGRIEWREKGVVKSEVIKEGVMDASNKNRETSAHCKKVSEEKSFFKLEVKTEETIEKSPPMTDCSISLGRLRHTSSVSGSALSFAGLIKKSADTVVLPRNAAKEVSPDVASGVSLKDEENLYLSELASDSVQPPISIFGSVLNSFQKAISDNSYKSKAENVCSFFQTIVKPEIKQLGPEQVECKDKASLQNPSQVSQVSPSSVSSMMSAASVSIKDTEVKHENIICSPKIYDTKGSKLSDTKNLAMSKESSCPIRLGSYAISENVKNPLKLEDGKTAVRLGDAKSNALNDTKSTAGFSGTESPVSLSDAKISLNEAEDSMKLNDNRTAASLGVAKGLKDAECAKKLGDITGPLSLLDVNGTKSFEMKDTKSDIKGPAEKNFAKLCKSSPKVTEELGKSKNSAKPGEPDSPAKLDDSNMEKEMIDTNPSIKFSDIINPLASDMPPAANLSNIAPKLSGINTPVKLIEVNSSSKNDDCTNPSGIHSMFSDSNPPPGTNAQSKLHENPSMSSNIKKEEYKPKDNFDLLLEGSTHFGHDSPKIPDAKDIFNFSFGSHSMSKACTVTDAPFPKLISDASDPLCHITVKSSETVDVSKMIPGILERLKKDVDSKDSPPREELSFDFLRSSQISSKSLSRSDSSNSLRICESDTNDSNTESKCNQLTEVPTTESARLPEIPSEFGLSTSKNVIGQQTAVITTSPKATLLSQEKGSVKQEPKNISRSVAETTTSKPKVAPDSVDSLFHKEDFSVFSVKPPKISLVSKFEHKESLHLELNCTLDETPVVFEQSSVIKCVSDVAEAVCRESVSSDKKEQDHEDTKNSKSNFSQDLLVQNSNLVFLKDDASCSAELSEKVSNLDAGTSTAKDDDSQLSKRKKLAKKSVKKLGIAEISEKEGRNKDFKIKEGKIKLKKRLRAEHAGKVKHSELKAKAKKIKKNKKRFSRNDDSLCNQLKKYEFQDDDQRLTGDISEKIRRRDRRRSEKKFLKSSFNNEEFPESKLELKKKKSKKNRDKLAGEKKDFFEKKKKKKSIPYPEDNQDTDSEKDSLKVIDKKKKKERKKMKNCSSSDEGGYFKEQNKASYLDSSKCDDPDMSFLLCEEKVPASPGVEMVDDSSDTSSNDGELSLDLLPGVYPSCDQEHSVLDNTPPTTPSSTESLLSSSPSHHEAAFPHYPTQEEASELFHGVARASEEYRAAATLAFAVCKSVGEAPSTSAKREGEDCSPSKRKKRHQAAKSAAFPRKADSYCEDSSGPTTSSSPPYGTLSSLTRSLPHRSIESRNFYVPLQEKDPEKRISVLQDKMAALRKKYMSLRAEVIAIDHKRRRARKKIRESGVTYPPVHSEDGQSCS